MHRAERTAFREERCTVTATMQDVITLPFQIYLFF